MQRFRLTRHQSASNKTPRQINLSLVFNLIRTRQPISRAELSRISGLQRSTVSLIVEELISGGWIIEGEIGRLPRGRRPTFLQINDKRAVLALDIHPSQTTLGIVDLAGRVVSQSIVPLPDDARAAMNAIIKAVRRMVDTHPERSLDGIGICIPGRADLEQQKLIFAPNLHWPVLAVKQRMERATDLRVEMDNVANACALSEVWFGESDGMHDLVVVNVAEGIGTGIFANGQLLRGEEGMAGEFGHVQIDENGPACACGSNGCWEVTASNRAALRYYEEASGSRLASYDNLLHLAQNGDKHALTALQKAATYLGKGLRMIASGLAPSEIVIVGDITTVWQLVASCIDTEMRRNAFYRGPKLRPAFEGSLARLRSAVALVMNDRAL
ncbi:ROK family transcriptional regulator [Terriglobus tenax]|uniref:ROK family transcriptional regulator n=1 Tax=Terriglobus tenax TaxID=1111115 RepID=UPI0021E0E2DA|nr:ROK family protein [Terriglobus tenax]